MAIHILTGHAALKYHPSKLNCIVKPTCPLCEAEDKTVSHFLGQCPMLRKLRVEFIDTYYTTASNIVDIHSLRQTIRYANKSLQVKADRTNQLEPVTS